MRNLCQSLLRRLAERRNIGCAMNEIKHLPYEVDEHSNRHFFYEVPDRGYSKQKVVRNGDQILTPQL
jgi:hypothetical protein